MASTKVVVLMATYNDWESVAELLPKIDRELGGIDASGHVVIVDDGSTDLSGQDQIGSLKLSAIDTVDCIDLYRNQGNQRANAVGLAYCEANTEADYLILMDSDQEDKPEYIPEMIKTCADNADQAIIFAERAERSEGIAFRFFYGVYQWLYKLLTGMNIAIGNFSVIPRALVPRIANIAELWSHYPAAVMRARILFKTVHSERGKRTRGQSKMNIVSLLLHALSGFTVHAETIGARVLVMAGAAGVFVLGLVAVLIGVRLFTDFPILGWTSQIVGLLVVLVFQIVITAAIMVFLVIAVRMQPPMVPALEFAKFVMRTERLYPASPG